MHYLILRQRIIWPLDCFNNLNFFVQIPLKNILCLAGCASRIAYVLIVTALALYLFVFLGTM